MNRFCKTIFLMLGLLALPEAGARASEPPAPWELDEQRARQLCGTMAGYEPGPLATATEADRRLFAGEPASCVSFIYGEAEDRDYDQGRRCCLVHGCNRELALIFANGWGVPRDYDAATWFLCRAREENGGQELNFVELWGMLAAVQEMRTSGNPEDLDYCGHFATSGVAALYCEGLAVDAEAPKLERRIAAVADLLGPAARAALADLRKAAEAFAEADADLRSAGSRGGSGYNAIRLSERREVGNLFLDDLERFGRERATPAASRPKNPVAVPGNLPPETLRDAQRAWLRYRDAWAAFYRLRWQGAAPPEALDREIRTALTRQRTAELRQLAMGE